MSTDSRFAIVQVSRVNCQVTHKNKWLFAPLPSSLLIANEKIRRINSFQSVFALEQTKVCSLVSNCSCCSASPSPSAAQKLALKEWRNPITVQASDSVAKVFKVMMDEGIQIAPALTEKGDIHCWVSLLDLARLATQLVDSFDRRTVTAPKLMDADRQFLEARVVDLQIVPNQARQVPDPDCSIWKLFELLRRGPGWYAVLAPAGRHVSRQFTRDPRKSPFVCSYGQRRHHRSG